MFKFRCYSCGYTMGDMVPAEALSLEQSLAVGGDVPMEYISPLMGTRFEGMSMGSFCTFCQWVLVNAMPAMQNKGKLVGHKMEIRTMMDLSEQSVVCECNYWPINRSVKDTQGWANRIMLIHTMEEMGYTIPTDIIDLANQGVTYTEEDYIRMDEAKKKREFWDQMEPGWQAQYIDYTQEEYGVIMRNTQCLCCDQPHGYEYCSCELDVCPNCSIDPEIRKWYIGRELDLCVEVKADGQHDWESVVEELGYGVAHMFFMAEPEWLMTFAIDQFLATFPELNN